MDEYIPVDDDLYPTPVFHRASTWAFIGAGVIAVALLLWWARIGMVSRNISGLTERGQYDSAWTRLRASGGMLGDCKRYELATPLLMRDERQDSLALKVADSFRTCNPEPSVLTGLTARGKLRIASRAKSLDSATRQHLFSDAFNAATKCVQSDPENKECSLDGARALGGLKDVNGQTEWIKSALTKWPKDTALLSLQVQAKTADSLAKAAAQPAAPAPSAPPAKKATAPKKHKK